jgi:tetratricopeptide (TPR) repeat protein
MALPGTGHPVSLSFRAPADMRDVIRLMIDLSGDEMLAPAGPLGRCSMFANDLPFADARSALLAAARLDAIGEGGRILVIPTADPSAVPRPINSGRRYGHVPGRETRAMARPAGMSGLLASELTLTGLVRRGDAWRVMSSLGLHAVGVRFYDAVLESVGPEGARIRLDTGAPVEWRIAAAAPGIALQPESTADRIERARAARDARAFDEAERLLREETSTLDGVALRAALADVHFEHAQVLLERSEVIRAVRELEAAFEIDRRERPWQAGEDLNEIGFAWASIGEPERAVVPHRQALELARTADLTKEPVQGTCVRMHPRSSWIEPSALNGLANAERERGRLGEARGLYRKAIRAWQQVGDGHGASAAMSGLGLVASAAGNAREALKLQQEALDTKDLDPAARGAIRNNLARAQLDLGKQDAALASYQAALADYRSVRDPAGEGVVLANLGALFESRGAHAKACASFSQALDASQRADDRRGEADARARLERLAAASVEDARRADCRAALVPKGSESR